MSNYLPNTSLTTLSIGSKIYAYSQTFHGQLREVQGRLQTEKNRIYYSEGYTTISPTARWRDPPDIEPGAPKMFTPLAAASIAETRYLIYVSDDNILFDVVYENGGWKPGTLSQAKMPDGRTGVRCATYSKLAAATVTFNRGSMICVYYQKPDHEGPVGMVAYAPAKGGWITDLAKVLGIVTDLKDPPLYATSLTAVKPRKGLTLPREPGVQPEIEELPVVYFQWETNALAHGQGTNLAPIPGLEKLALSPHTSLTAVDDGTNLYCFYKSNDNSIRMIRIEGGIAKPATDKLIGTPTPRSSIAAVMPLQHQDRIILIYQVWESGKSEKVEIKAKTLAKQPDSTWSPIHETRLVTD
ncbi:hypothetical protein GP486_002480 [Trichoglossum hirsutum]|uniref:Fucose-specific lectin n=1 Tax=Trichoglossum hirsutum TaxID=265104 RepID=A0A9P8RRP4_9PEZI|nr:hypothetical protein GP486_002480 [Trichoglossum hirsutum]